MDIRTTMGSFLKAADVVDKPLRLTIKHCAMEKVGQDGNQETKPVLYFTDNEKGLVLNVTNSNTIADAFGYETDDWTGCRVEVYHDETFFQGKKMPCLRVRTPSRQISEPPADHVSPQATGPQDENIPF